jgi:flavin reductase (DIM6/NTAB) family NADH-FMN oxidoreductase RutF
MPSTAAHPALDPALFRRALAHVPTAVSVISTMTGDGPAGMTVGSFASISLDPPLTGFFANGTSQTLPVILRAGRFSASILADSQTDLSRAFASRSGSRFDAAAWHLSETGVPHLAGALAWIDCTVQSAIEIGDHTAVVGAVDSLKVAENAGRPLVFFRGAHCHLDKRSVPRRGDWQLDHYGEW